MADDRDPEYVRTLRFPWHPGQAADESEREAPARAYPRQLRRYDPIERTPDTPEETP